MQSIPETDGNIGIISKPLIPSPWDQYRSQSKYFCAFFKGFGKNDKVAKNIFWTGAGGPHLIGNFGRFGDTQPLQSSL